MARRRQARQCKARRRNGQRCKAYAIRGGTVCVAHGGRARQVRREADVRYWQGRILPAFERGYRRWREELRDWQVNRILAAADILGIPPADVTEGDLLWCVIEHGLQGEDSAPELRVDGRYGPRTPRQLATRAARQAQRNTARKAAP